MEMIMAFSFQMNLSEELHQKALGGEEKELTNYFH